MRFIQEVIDRHTAPENVCCVLLLLLLLLDTAAVVGALLSLHPAASASRTTAATVGISRRREPMSGTLCGRRRGAARCDPSPRAPRGILGRWRARASGRSPRRAA